MIGYRLCAALALVRPPRAYGHVYCRYRRDGRHEPGFDLTDFLSIPEGPKYEPRLPRAVEPGRVVSYALVTVP